MALSDADMAAIRASNKEFDKNLEKNMVTYYQVFLGDNPTYHQYFDGVQGVKVEDFGDSAYIRDFLGPKTGRSFATFVEKMDDMDKMKAFIAPFVRVPHSQVTLTKVHYENAFVAYVKTYESVLGAGFTESDRKAWTKFIAILLEIIGKELKEMGIME